MRSIILAMLAGSALVGCTTPNASAPDDGPMPAPTGSCDASGVQNHIGHRASAEAGATLLRLTGARQLRWVPPRTAVTMDYREDRLTVSYDDAMMIDRISCG